MLGRIASAAGRPTVSGSALGRTPTRLGYNVGDFNNDNTASWWRYTGVNAGRMFTSPSTLTPSSVIKSTTNAALNASSQSQFLAQRGALRASGTAATHLNWSSIAAANANLGASKTLSIDLAPWGVPVGAVVTNRQASDLHQGDVSQTITVDSTRTISVTQDPGDVVLVRAPTAVETQTVIPASQDGYVNQGSPTTSFNGDELRVRNSGSAASGRDVTFLKFPVTGVDPGSLTHALLGITALDPAATSGTSAGIITHVYGVNDNAWSAGSITGNNAPNLGDPAAVISTIDDNYVTGLGTTAQIIGQFAATGTEQLLQVDVSRWVRERLEAGASNLTFLIARQIRYDGDVDGTQSLAIRSAEYASGAFAPTLTIAAVPEPALLPAAVAAGLLTVAVRHSRRPQGSAASASRRSRSSAASSASGS